MTLENYNLRHGTDYTDIWRALESQILYVLDENGVNMANGQVRHLLGDAWLYVDDQDGYDILTTDRVENLYLADERPRLGYSRNGEVVDA